MSNKSVEWAECVHCGKLIVGTRKNNATTCFDCFQKRLRGELK